MNSKMRGVKIVSLLSTPGRTTLIELLI